MDFSQLALPVKLDDHARFESFFAGPNAEIVAALVQTSAGAGESLCWIWGSSGSGRSHLLQACVARCQQAGRRPIYVPLSSGLLDPEVLEDVAALDLICLDDVDKRAGSELWERALFRVYEGVRSAGSRLVMTAAGPPAAAGFRLPDLASRMGAAAVYRLQPMDDDDRAKALAMRARVRGLDLPPETARFLLSRVSRDNASLFQLLDRLDEASLASGRRLTIPFVRQTLAMDR